MRNRQTAQLDNLVESGHVRVQAKHAPRHLRKIHGRGLYLLGRLQLNRVVIHYGLYGRVANALRIHGKRGSLFTENVSFFFAFMKSLIRIKIKMFRTKQI